MLSDDLLHAARSVRDTASLNNLTVLDLRRYCRALAINLEAMADRSAAMEACYDMAIDDAVATGPNVLPFRRAVQR